jgi:hypothetical protein
MEGGDLRQGAKTMTVSKMTKWLTRDGWTVLHQARVYTATKLGCQSRIEFLPNGKDEPEATAVCLRVERLGNVHTNRSQCAVGHQGTDGEKGRTMSGFGRITSKTIELRRGLEFWSWKWLEETESKWHTSKVPISISQRDAADLIAAEVMSRFPKEEMVGLTVLVRA